MTAKGAARLEVFKALGDNTRYAIYLEFARSPRPLATAEIAAELGLHPNTVRPHLDQMREAGLLEMSTGARGEVGRPQHRFQLAADAPSLGLEPAVLPLLSRMLLRVASAAGVSAEEAVDIGREQGLADPSASQPGVSCDEVLQRRLADLGFDPVSVRADETVTIEFGHCPFRDLAEENPDIVCGLHRGMVEGLIAQRDDAEVTSFRSLIDRDPCQVDLELAIQSGGGAR